MARPRKDDDTPYLAKPRRRRATTREGRENQLIALAEDLAEDQLRNGTASSQVQVHYLKLGTVREEMERDNLRAQNKLLAARVEALQNFASGEEMAAAALAAFTGYKPQDEGDEYSGVNVTYED